MRLDSYCKYTKNYANHNFKRFFYCRFSGWILIANILKIMRITTCCEMFNFVERLDSYCKYTKNYANHNHHHERMVSCGGWILIANILKIMRITTNSTPPRVVLEVGFLLQIY